MIGKKNESQKLKIFKDKRSNNINAKAWAKHKTWLRIVKNILQREKSVYFLPIQAQGKKSPKRQCNISMAVQKFNNTYE